MSYTNEFFERVEILGRIASSAGMAAASSRQTATIDMGAFRRLVVLASATGTSARNTYPHAHISILDATVTGTCSGTAIATGTMLSGTIGVWDHAILEIRAEQVGKQTTRSGTGQLVRVRTRWGTKPAQVAVTVIGVDPRYTPRSNS